MVATVDELYRQITEEQPSRLASHIFMMNMYQSFASHISGIRERIRQTGENDPFLKSHIDTYKKTTGTEPLPPTEYQELLNKLKGEFHRRIEAYKQTEEYKLEQEKMKDFLD